MSVTCHRSEPCTATHRAPRPHSQVPTTTHRPFSRRQKLPRRRDAKLWVYWTDAPSLDPSTGDPPSPPGCVVRPETMTQAQTTAQTAPWGVPRRATHKGQARLQPELLCLTGSPPPRTARRHGPLIHGCPVPRPIDPRHYDCPPVPVSHRSQRSNPEPPGRIDPHQSGTGTCTPSRAPSAERSKPSRTELAARHRVTPADPTAACTNRRTDLSRHDRRHNGRRSADKGGLHRHTSRQ
jgi:hypothetical protein